MNTEDFIHDLIAPASLAELVILARSGDEESVEGLKCVLAGASPQEALRIKTALALGDGPHGPDSTTMNIEEEILNEFHPRIFAERILDVRAGDTFQLLKLQQYFTVAPEHMQRKINKYLVLPLTP